MHRRLNKDSVSEHIRALMISLDSRSSMPAHTSHFDSSTNPVLHPQNTFESRHQFLMIRWAEGLTYTFSTYNNIASFCRSERNGIAIFSPGPSSPMCWLSRAWHPKIFEVLVDRRAATMFPSAFVSLSTSLPRCKFPPACVIRPIRRY